MDKAVTEKLIIAFHKRISFIRIGMETTLEIYIREVLGSGLGLDTVLTEVMFYLGLSRQVLG